MFKNSLDGEWIVVTGATGYLGSYLLRQLLKTGCNIIELGRNSKSKDSEFHDDKKGIYRHVFCDFSIDDSIQQALIKTEEITDKIFGVVHLAVMRDSQSDLENYKKTFKKSVANNAQATFLIWEHFSQRMSNTGGGSLVYISSIYGAVAPEFSVYDGTAMGTEPDYSFMKSGGVALSKFYASKYGHLNVRSNSIILGGVYNNQPKVFVDRYSQRTCLKRMARPEELVGPCMFLLSSESSYITGAEIPVDGGLLSL